MECASAEPPSGRSLVTGRKIAKNTVWNLAGQVLPLCVGVVVTPFLIKFFGTEKFGVLSLAWIVVGYFSLFDFGLGRAVTKLIAELLGTDRHDAVVSVFWTSLLLMLATGMAGGLLMAVLTPWLAAKVLHIPTRILPETITAFYWLSVATPIVIVTAGLQGVLAAFQRFRSFAIVRCVTGVWSFVGPLLAIPFGASLATVAWLLVAGRGIACALSFWFCVGVDGRFIRPTWARETVCPLFSFGTWMTVSNVVGPIMMYFDRFLIGTVLTMTAVAYYTTPYDVVTRTLIIPTSLLGVLFPAFSTSFAMDRRHGARLFERALTFLFLFMFPLTVVLVVFSYDFLKLWLGYDFAVHSGPVFQWIALGVFINSFGMLPFGSIQADGRPDITAKLHLLELPIYFVVLYFSLLRWGIEGAAIAWTTRAFLDDIALYFVALRQLPEARSGVFRKGSLVLLSCILFVVLILLKPTSLLIKVGLVIPSLLLFCFAAWHRFLDADERTWLIARMGTGLGA